MPRNTTPLITWPDIFHSHNICVHVMIQMTRQLLMATDGVGFFGWYFIGCLLLFVGWSIVCYRQHCAQRKAPVFKLLKERFWGFFAPHGRHVAPIGVKFGVEEWTEGSQKLKILLKFYQISQNKRPAGAYPLRNFHKIYKVCTPFQVALAFKIWLDLLKGLRS